ncbi:DUF1642 domain-containing protein [Streptococcus oralis]|uniref:DUF1642 domain-containing protein n=1 Tax=Streptococcus oralis TaxID=1303 RepID=UPI0022849455|nr:DUF1642 domain-containing protein [Streptococcus oralis]MCY7062928.1 DUF1642 domain-containing protein [Streptococcus oralis]
MNVKELIEKIEGLNKVYGEKFYVSLDDVLDLVKQLDEPQPVKVQQCVADWYEENKDDFEGNLFRCVYNITSIFDGAKLNEFEKWFLIAGTKSFQTLVNMHQFGYEVEKEKRYLVKVKGVNEECEYLVFGELSNTWKFRSLGSFGELKKHHTRKELEEANFGWVFDCPGVEVEEVE